MKPLLALVLLVAIFAGIVLTRTAPATPPASTALPATPSAQPEATPTLTALPSPTPAPLAAPKPKADPEAAHIVKALKAGRHLKMRQGSTRRALDHWGDILRKKNKWSDEQLAAILAKLEACFNAASDDYSLMEDLAASGATSTPELFAELTRLAALGSERNLAAFRETITAALGKDGEEFLKMSQPLPANHWSGLVLRQLENMWPGLEAAVVETLKIEALANRAAFDPLSETVTDSLILTQEAAEAIERAIFPLRAAQSAESLEKFDQRFKRFLDDSIRRGTVFLQVVEGLRRGK